MPLRARLLGTGRLALSQPRHARFDQWILEQYQRDGAKLKSGRRDFAGDAKEAARRHIPAVCDEAGYFTRRSDRSSSLTPPGTVPVRACGRSGHRTRILGHDADDLLRTGGPDLAGPAMAADHQRAISAGKTDEYSRFVTIPASGSGRLPQVCAPNCTANAAIAYVRPAPTAAACRVFAQSPAAR